MSLFDRTVGREVFVTAGTTASTGPGTAIVDDISKPAAGSTLGSSPRPSIRADGLPVPNNATLTGIYLASQAGAGTAATGPLGLDLSNALFLALGR